MEKYILDSYFSIGGGRSMINFVNGRTTIIFTNLTERLTDVLYERLKQKKEFAL